MHKRSKTMTVDEAETIALRALGYIASEPARLTAFIGETGVTLDQLHMDATAPNVMLAVLELLLRDEPNLLMFTANAGLEADSVAQALHVIEARNRQ